MPLASHPEAPPVSARPRLLVERLEFAPDPERAFVHIYGESANAFWLDGEGGGERGRFSFMGDAAGPLAAVVAYDLERREVRVESGEGVELRDESIFAYLERELSGPPAADSELPFDFQGGFVGFFGYELKAECGAAVTHSASTPDAAFVRVDRLVVIDRFEGLTYLLALVAPPVHQICLRVEGKFDARGAGRWMAAMARRVRALPKLEEPCALGPVDLRLRRSAERYREDVEACKRYLRTGDSYEICLTDKLVGEAKAEPLDIYRVLRRANPAPHSAYLRIGDLAVLSSSPERFLAVDRDGRVESRPIKGTSRRAADPAEDARFAAALVADPKNRAENVTIVDLVRNDLGRVCRYGSVEADPMRVETYATVHQLVSAVRGRLRDGLGALDAIRACFPAGSMTGAPKLRTMEILDELEGEARGVYSGAIGWLGTGGACDLAVAIRTIVLEGRRATIGAGGAIVVESDPEAEVGEMLLKAGATAAPISFGARPNPDREQERWP